MTWRRSRKPVAVVHAPGTDATAGADLPGRPLTDERKAAYEAVKDEKYRSAKAASDSLRRGPEPRPRTAYSLSREATRLSRLPNSNVRPVSANTIRNNERYRDLLDVGDAVVRADQGSGPFPRELGLMTKAQLIRLVARERAWAEDSSERLIAAEEKLGLKLVDLRERLRLDQEL